MKYLAQIRHRTMLLWRQLLRFCGVKNWDNAIIRHYYLSQMTLQFSYDSWMTVRPLYVKSASFMTAPIISENNYIYLSL